ncbi:pyridoxal phosphate-dependent aminotransferase [Streptomyces alfalfae]|uniref:cysteine-S-conjugate beta-lyase n=1 Tax=Streptomyces alfalfae TaxID=1642299 RepID=A0A1P8TQA6_9ACTN|nr:MalY/PatB family protein [Streptomyces alfalfae]AYA20286.1 pyridoxal phosphate-dependent aminotransferase [Streptomyces fradiae]APY89829.1 transcriptional regulator [Streptomyces alfalfae]QQC87680.1 pyridoxal phosphate-dependent aminotransferase [Streptomyces alfalfae]QUI30111.1 pyridoxal phosphate-dependent aminotransferase [Streptomyces alfalfae]RXX42651.1 pyridoxal phosphate-dependent aminotransferase [Streptomyces alfalfae]
MTSPLPDAPGSGAPVPLPYDFDTPVDRRGTWCTQWDYVEDRFGVPDLLPFTISDMDFETAPEVMAALRARLDHGVLGYSRWRQDDFLSAVAHWYATRHATRVDTGSIVYGPSVIYQLSALLRLWSRPGDGVVTHTPTYDAFPKTVAAAGRELRGCPLGDRAGLEELLALPDTSVLLLCSPHNPTGHVWTAEELDRMAELCDRHGVAVISDEIHADLAHAPHVHRPWARHARPDGRWAMVTSASKSFNIPALTGSYGVIGDAPSREAYLRRLKEADGLSSPAVLSLVGHIAAYREGAPWLDALRDYVAGNLALVAERLNGAFPGLGWQPPQAGYLAWIDLRPLGVDDDALQRELIEVEKVAVMPGSIYGAPGRVRLNVGCPRAKAEAGVRALVDALSRLTP